MVNQVMLVGHLGQAPELRQTTGGKPVATFSVATNKKWKDGSGKEREDTQWHRVVTYGAQASSCGRCLSKGRQVFVQGELRTHEWTDKEGLKRWTTEVIAQRVVFLGKAERSPDDRDAPPPDDDELPM